MHLKVYILENEFTWVTTKVTQLGPPGQKSLLQDHGLVLTLFLVAYYISHYS